MNTKEIMLAAQTERTINQMAVLRGKSFDEMLEKIIEVGIYNINYRTARNKQKWAEHKADKERMDAMEAELARLNSESVASE